jgi:FAD/FMN-containing dehydrogenase
MTHAEALDAIRDLLGPKGLVAEDEVARYLVEWRDKFKGKAALVALPANTKEVSGVLNIANEAGLGVVPQGGNTGLVGGQIPSLDGSQIILNLSRMNTIRAIDIANDTMLVDAGCVLATVQGAALDAGRMFPLSLASEGSAEIGGLLSTNAGGINVLRYGNARAQVLGLEVVLPNGDIWDGLKGLRKDNTGYDLKQLFMGAEGTLGVITAAVLKLFPAPRDKATCFVALDDLDAVVALLGLTREMTGELVSAFELVPAIGLEFLGKHKGYRSPLDTQAPWYVLMELSSTDAPGTLKSVLEPLLEAALAKGLISDAAIAETMAQTADFWRLREELSEVQKFEGGSIKHDIAVQISDIPAFVARAVDAVTKSCPGVRPVIFGHIGDGNLHFNLTQPEDADKEAYLASWETLARTVHDITARMKGSISAEHGIGQLKRDDLNHYKDKVEMDLMRALKKMIDPKGIMNPGKVL